MAQLVDIVRVEVDPEHLTARVRISPEAPLMTSEDLEGTTRIYRLMPHIIEHVCLGDSGESFKEVMGNTELAHLLEHVTVELLAQTNIAGDISTGRTWVVDESALLYEIELSCPDDILVAGALSTAAWILQWAYTGGVDPQPNMEAIIAGLTHLVEAAEEGEDLVIDYGPDFDPVPLPEPEPAPAFLQESAAAAGYPPIGRPEPAEEELSQAEPANEEASGEAFERTFSDDSPIKEPPPSVRLVTEEEVEQLFEEVIATANEPEHLVDEENSEELEPAVPAFEGEPEPELGEELAAVPEFKDEPSEPADFVAEQADAGFADEAAEEDAGFAGGAAEQGVWLEPDLEPDTEPAPQAEPYPGIDSAQELEEPNEVIPGPRRVR